MRQESSPKVAWLLVGLAVLAMAGLLWWFLIRCDPAARAEVETIPPGYNPITGKQLVNPSSSGR
jgi:cytoskeletal protein RodZ